MIAAFGNVGVCANTDRGSPAAYVALIPSDSNAARREIPREGDSDIALSGSCDSMTPDGVTPPCARVHFASVEGSIHLRIVRKRFHMWRNDHGLLVHDREYHEGDAGQAS